MGHFSNSCRSEDIFKVRMKTAEVKTAGELRTTKQKYKTADRRDFEKVEELRQRKKVDKNYPKTLSLFKF